MLSGETSVEVCVDPANANIVGACLVETPGYSEWCKENVAFGFEIQTMTIEEMLDRCDGEDIQIPV